MRITVLTHAPTGGPPDAVVEQVATALAPGHEVQVLAVRDGIAALVSELPRQRPDLVFNLVEELGDNLQADAAVAAVLELLEIPFTGGGAAELYLRQDKALAKKVLAFEGLPYPNFVVFSTDADLETGGRLRLPLFVKPLRADASIGIGEDALVHDSSALLERVARIHRDLGDSALAEEYIEGRELYVSILGNQQPEALPPVELDFSAMPPGAPHVAHRAAKFEEGTAAFRGCRSVLAELPDELRARVQDTALRAYRALKVRDYGRVDLRLTDAGELYVLEVNANCYLEQQGELVMAAAAAGYDYPALVERIVALAVERQRPRRALATR
jgi:D-alanine-D-alanine ligase